VNCGKALSQLLQRPALDTLGPIDDEFLARPAGFCDAPAEVVQILLRNLDLERPDVGGDVSHLNACHHSPLVRGLDPKTHSKATYVTKR
jgi:hypothetical protein